MDILGEGVYPSSQVQTQPTIGLNLVCTDRGPPGPPPAEVITGCSANRCRGRSAVPQQRAETCALSPQRESLNRTPTQQPCLVCAPRQNSEQPGGVGPSPRDAAALWDPPSPRRPAHRTRPEAASELRDASRQLLLGKRRGLRPPRHADAHGERPSDVLC